MRAVLLLVGLAASAHAQDRLRAFELPWSDRAPAIVAGALRAAAVGLPDDRLGRLAARRDQARRSSRDRAIAALHRHADDALSRAGAGPACADAVHRAIDAGARVEGVRPLADGGAVSVVSIELTRLRAACDLRGLPWSA